MVTVGKGRCGDSDPPEFGQRYNEFVRTSPQGTLYCQKWWLDAVAPDRHEILTVESGGQIQAAWPIVWANTRRRSQIVMPHLTQKLGILFAPSEAKYAERLSKEHRLIEELLSQIPPGTHINTRFHENFSNWLPFYWHGYQQTARYTYVFEDLVDLDAIWAAMRRNLRTEIRKAEKRGLVCHDIDDLRCFYEFNARIFARRGLATPYSFEVLQRIDEACLRNAGRRILVARDSEGHIQACRYLVHDQNRALLVAGGVDDALRGSGANCLVDWEMIKFAATVSKQFDFTGSMMQGIEPYLREFGASRRQYSRIWGCASQPSNSPLRRFAGRVLRHMARIVDPWQSGYVITE